MSTVTKPSSAAAAKTRIEPDRIILYDIPWSLYIQLREADDRRGVRMSYLDGTLELMSPKYIHDKAGQRLDQFLMAVMVELEIPCICSRSTTLKRRGKGKKRKKGVGKEPDTAYYIANEPAIRDKDDIDLKMMPPPDLALEVDNTNDSEEKLPIYARLGVPEVWRYDVNTRELWFGFLQADGTYAQTERSTSLPMLTPALVLEGLDLCVGVSESQWGRLLRDWIKEKLT
jgi:Uma2 family endonuclease